MSNRMILIVQSISFKYGFERTLRYDFITTKENIVMKSTNIFPCLVLVFFCCSIFFNLPALYATQTGTRMWSFAFQNCSISDALNRINTETGIDIFTNGQVDETRFNKSYNNQTVYQILKDIFRKESHAILWRYGNSGLEAIEIWTLKSSGNGKTDNTRSFVKYNATSTKSNVTGKSQEGLKSSSRNSFRNNFLKHTSFNGGSEGNELQSEVSVRMQSRKFRLSRAEIKSSAFKESVLINSDVEQCDTGNSALRPSPGRRNGL